MTYSALPRHESKDPDLRKELSLLRAPFKDVLPDTGHTNLC